ncbi:MAG: glycosyltransferase family 2 protein [Myxococcales bacterium]|nr:glycosyltransferase family 2 protein [Myxococcales bacterium]
MSPAVPWIVVPAYRAEATLGAVLERVPGWLAEPGGRVLVVDDGSDDGTAEVARAHGATVLVERENRGYARAQKRGLRAALAGGASAVAILHADGQYPPEALPELLRPVLRGDADVVLGSRVLDGGARARGMPRYKYAANRALSWLENRCYGLGLSEYHTGMMAYARHVLVALPFEHVSDTFHFDGEMAMLAGRRGFRLRELPIAHVYAGERSYLRPIPYGLTVVAIALGVRLGLYDRWLARRARQAPRG